MKKVKIDGVEYILTSEAQEINYVDVYEDTTCSYCYGEIEDGAELSTDEIINPENKQKKMYDGVIAHVECVHDSETEEAMSRSSRYTDYHDTPTDRMFDVVSNPESNEEEIENAKKEYLAKIEKMFSSYRDLSDDANAMIKEAEESRFENCGSDLT